MNPAQPSRLRGTPSESPPVVGEIKTDSGPVEIAPLIRVLTAVIFPRNRLKYRFAVASGAAFVLGVPGDPARFGRRHRAFPPHKKEVPPLALEAEAPFN
jgi:hypothetical protein